MKACVFTGHRPHKFSFGDDETHPDCLQLKEKLAYEINVLIQDGVRTFITGMAQGVDMWAAEIVLTLKHTYSDLRLWAVIPYDRQASCWSEQAQLRYQHILSQADQINYVSHEYFPGCLQKRNRYMVDHATHLIAAYNGQPGGTRMTLQYAQRTGKSIILLDTFALHKAH